MFCLTGKKYYSEKLCYQQLYVTLYIGLQWVIHTLYDINAPICQNGMLTYICLRTVHYYIYIWEQYFLDILLSPGKDIRLVLSLAPIISEDRTPQDPSLKLLWNDHASTHSVISCIIIPILSLSHFSSGYF